MDNEAFFRAGLDELKAAGNLRALPQVEHDGRYVSASGRRMLNLSSNDYLGIASEGLWQREFLAGGFALLSVKIKFAKARENTKFDEE